MSNTQPKIMLQKCLICNYTCAYEVLSKEDEDTIRASCLSCGHQGMFTLLEEDHDGLSRDR